MSESGDYTPSPHWKGHDFDDARKSYASHAATSFSKAKVAGVKLGDRLPEKLVTLSRNPMVVAIDQTGSVGDWPGTMRSKLPYLEHEAKTEYMGEDVEISWGAFGDAHNHENYPVQARPFTKGKDLDIKIHELILEGNGGGTQHENSEMSALYYARNVEMPNAIRPLFILFTDESPYAYINPKDFNDHSYPLGQELMARLKLTEKITTPQIFAELKQVWSVYIIQKPYGDERLVEGPLTGVTKKVHEDWVALVGEDHIAMLGDPNRVVDVIFGIMAREAGKIGYFKKEIEDRQKPEQVKTVYTALKTVHALPKGADSKHRLGDGHSVTRKSKKEKE